MPDAPPSAAGSQRALLEQLLFGGSVRRSADLLAAGVRAQALADAVRSGLVVRAAPGVYHLSSAPYSSAKIAIATACARAPKAIVCLLSAAYLGDLIDEPPPVVWLAQPLGTHVPEQGITQERILNWSYGGAFDVGIVRDEVCGVTLRRTDPARTIVDLFRHARYLGEEDTGSRAGIRFIERGGTLSDVLEVASQLATPTATMRRLMAAADRWQHIRVT